MFKLCNYLGNRTIDTLLPEFLRTLHLTYTNHRFVTSETAYMYATLNILPATPLQKKFSMTFFFFLLVHICCILFWSN